jgi:large subunit ribosomal protein L10
MVSKKKIETVKEVREKLKNYSVIGILDMHNLPSRQLHAIREKLRKEATIRMVKKRLITLIFKECGLKGIEDLTGYISGEPALLLSNSDPFKLARKISTSKSKAFAKTGDIAPHDIVIKAGPTPLPPGPAIGDLQRLKIPAGVEGDKIAVKQDTVVAKEGEEIRAELTPLLSKLGIEPMEIGLNLIAAWEKGIIYDKAVLFIPQEKHLEDLKQAHSNAFNLSFAIGHFTKENIIFFLQKAQGEAVALATDRGIVTQYTVQQLLAKGESEMKSLKSKLGSPKEEEKPEEPKEPEQKEEDQKEPEREKPKEEEKKENKEKKKQEQKKKEKPKKEKKE